MKKTPWLSFIAPALTTKQSSGPFDCRSHSCLEPFFKEYIYLFLSIGKPAMEGNNQLLLKEYNHTKTTTLYQA